MSCPFRKKVSKKKRQEIIQSTNSHKYSIIYQASYSHSHPAHSYSQVLAHSNSPGHSSSMTAVKTNGGPDNITMPIESIPPFEKSSVSNAVSSVLIATVKNCENRAPLKRFWTPFWLQTASPLSIWVMLLHPRSSHLLQLTPLFQILRYPIVAWQTGNCFVRRSSLGFKRNCLQEKKNISELLSGNKLILKPPLKIDEVIEHLTSNKINIEVVNLSSSDFDQMLLSGKGTKDRNRVQ